MMQQNSCRMPAAANTASGAERRVGVEIELSGLSYKTLVREVASLLKGDPQPRSRYVTAVDTALGEFVIELDSDPIKSLDLAGADIPQSLRELGGQAMGVIDAAAERIVPLEIIAPPIAFSRVEDIERLVETLRQLGALGSREAIYYAFGLQLNPELPDLQATTITRYLQAFAGLYEWLKKRHQLDISRRFTPYIEPWASRYTEQLMSDGYAPSLEQLMEDYLHHNPTRNRALDLLPLFAHLDAPLLARHVQDPRIKKRPTLHYRLPDCDIDNPHWHFSTVWNDWVILDNIANNPADLAQLRAQFRDASTLSLHNLTHSKAELIHHWLALKGYV